MEMFQFWLRLSLFLRFHLKISQHWIRQWLGTDQVTSHYLNQWWLDYRRIYASLSLNELSCCCCICKSCYCFIFVKIRHICVTDVAFNWRSRHSLNACMYVYTHICICMAAGGIALAWKLWFQSPRYAQKIPIVYIGIPVHIHISNENNICNVHACIWYDLYEWNNLRFG